MRNVISQVMYICVTNDNIQCVLFFYCPATVIIGFQQLHYKVNEGDGCVRVCAQILAGRLTPPDSVSFRFVTDDNETIGKLALLCCIVVGCKCCNLLHLTYATIMLLDYFLLTILMQLQATTWPHQKKQ